MSLTSSINVSLYGYPSSVNTVSKAASEIPIQYPRRESCIAMMKEEWFPDWRLPSLTTLIVLAQIVMFVTTCVFGWNRYGTLFEIDKPTLIRFRANQPFLAYSGYMYRPITSLFILQNIQQLIVSIPSTIIICSHFEHSFGRMFIILIGVTSSLIGGSFCDLFSSKPYYDVFSGPYMALFGLSGGFTGYLMINWRGLQFLLDLHKKQFIRKTFLMLLLSLLSLVGQVDFDRAGFAASYLAGIFASGFLPSILNDSRYVVLKNALRVFLIVQGITFIAVFMFSNTNLSRK